ncbi:Putative E3 ubiquitin-protein ligase HERC1 [Durusdinium trenchii]|uniref:E3 ubiquitin-protein ligase HERC1 n=1 Tax=Durusdinium trenchii TaxID=1381693 RepID=A0ABP0LKG8_9DINO
MPDDGLPSASSQKLLSCLDKRIARLQQGLDRYAEGNLSDLQSRMKTKIEAAIADLEDIHSRIQTCFSNGVVDGLTKQVQKNLGSLQADAQRKAMDAVSLEGRMRQLYPKKEQGDESENKKKRTAKKGSYRPGPLAEAFAEAVADGVPASSIDVMARSAAVEARSSDLSMPKVTSSSAKNASRAAHRMINRYGFKWRIPISEMQYKFGTQTLHLPYMSPIDIYTYLIAHHREILFGGFTEDCDVQNLLESFWCEYRNVHPGHQLFQDNGPEGTETFGSVIPAVIYGDEGRGLRRGNTALVTLESPFGLSSAEKYRNNDHAFTCDKCDPDSGLQQQYPCAHGCPAQVPLAAYASTNFKEHVFLSRVPLFLVPCSLYKEHPDLLQFMVHKISQELKKLYHEGLVIGERKYRVALLGMKGDAKWLAQMGSLVRWYGKKGRKRNLAMCAECYAGLDRFPYEDVGAEPAWARTLWRSRPWDPESEPCFLDIPFDEREPERFLRRDLMHIGKLGLYRHHTASVICTLITWKLFAWQDAKNDIPTQLQRAHGHFKLWCMTNHRSPSLRSFSRTLFNWTNKSTYAWMNIKASDAVLVNQWIQEALLPSALDQFSDPRRTGMLKVMLEVSLSLSRFSKVLFSHNLLTTRRCCLQLYEHGTRALNGYAWLASEIAPVCAWAMVTLFTAPVHWTRAAAPAPLTAHGVPPGAPAVPRVAPPQSAKWQATAFALGALASSARTRSRRLPRCAADELGYGREDVGAGGSDEEGRYVWERRGMEILVTAPVGNDITKKDISAHFALRQVSVKVRGEVLFEGIPGCELEVDECFWEIDEEDGKKALFIHLAKRGTASRWPETLLKG